MSVRMAVPARVRERIAPDVSGQRWIGGADVRRVHEALGTDQVQINAVYLDAGARSRPHLHTHDQVLLYLSGTGIVAVDGGEDEVVETGAFALLPGGVVHMHGATGDGPACQLSIMRDVDMDFACPIPPQWERWRT